MTNIPNPTSPNPQTPVPPVSGNGSGPGQTNADIHDHPAWAINGFIMLGIFLIIAVLILVLGRVSPMTAFLAGTPAVIIGVWALTGFMVVGPNDAKVYNLFGRYNGTWTTPGFWWRVPFNTFRSVSRKLNNFESPVLKVNDALGTPIEVGTIVVWHVTEPARAILQIEDYQAFVRIQAESAVRQLAAYHPYDVSHTLVGQLASQGQLTADEAERQRRLRITLRGDPEAIAQELRRELDQRLTQVGVTIDDARIAHLAYAPEIASAMLQRQQAQAILDARAIIVEGAVQLTKSALAQLQRRGAESGDQAIIVSMDEHERAALASSLMVVLTGERSITPTMDVRRSTGIQGH